MTHNSLIFNGCLALALKIKKKKKTNNIFSTKN